MEDGIITMLVLSQSGLIFTQELFEVNQKDSGGPFILTRVVEGKKRIFKNYLNFKKVPTHLIGKNGGDSIFYSPTLQLLFCSYLDNKCFAGKLDKSKSIIIGAFPLYIPPSKPEPIINSKPIPHNYWMEIPGIIKCKEIPIFFLRTTKNDTMSNIKSKFCSYFKYFK